MTKKNRHDEYVTPAITKIKQRDALVKTIKWDAVFVETTLMSAHKYVTFMSYRVVCYYRRIKRRLGPTGPAWVFCSFPQDPR